MSDSTQPPSEAPTDLRAAFDDDGRFELVWDSSRLVGAEDFEVRGSQIRRGSSYSNKMAPGERRIFRVRARNAAGPGPWSRPLSIIGPRPTIQFGSVGPYVRTWQSHLNLTTGTSLAVSGEFDAATDEATRNLQRFFSNPADGIVAEGKWWTNMDFLVAYCIARDTKIDIDPSPPAPEPEPASPPEPAPPPEPEPDPVVVTPTPPPPPPGPTAPAGMKLYFADEFSGTTLDTRIWKPYHNTYGDGNKELQALTPANIEISDGTLKITSRRERYTTPRGITRDFTSGFLGTRENGVWFPRFGRFEMRARLPHGQGIWPAFWLRHRDGSVVAEVDVMEYFHSQLPGRSSATLHLDHVSNVVKNAGAFEAPTSSPGWHTWSVDMIPDGPDVLFTFRIDGKILPMRDNQKVLHNTWRNRSPNWVTRHKGLPLFDIALNTAVGGTWAGHPDGDNGKLGVLPLVGRCAQSGGSYPDACPTTNIRKASFPVTYEIDYVRMFELV